MNTTPSRIETVVLARAHTIHILSPLMSGMTLASVLILLSLWGIGREVFVAHVFENMPSLVDVRALGQFVAEAFINTRFIVQVLSVLALGGCVWLAREVFYALKHLSRGVFA